MSRVQPPILDIELVDIFMGILQSSYLDKMIGSVLSVFSDLIIIDERIENNLKNGKLQGVAGTISKIKKPSSNFHNKKEGETNIVTTYRERRSYQTAWAPAPLSYYQYPYISVAQYQQPSGPPYQMSFPPRGQYPPTN